MIDEPELRDGTQDGQRLVHDLLGMTQVAGGVVRHGEVERCSGPRAGGLTALRPDWIRVSKNPLKVSPDRTNQPGFEVASERVRMGMIRYKTLLRLLILFSFSSSLPVSELVVRTMDPVLFFKDIQDLAKLPVLGDQIGIRGRIGCHLAEINC